MDWEEKFRSSCQPKVKLDIALERLLEGEGISGEWERVYREYLSGRSYSALVRLVERGEPGRVRKFLALGLAGREQCSRVLRESCVENAEIRLLLMGLDGDVPPGAAVLTVEDAAFQAWELEGASLALGIPYLHLFFAEFDVDFAPVHLLTGTDGVCIFLQARQVVECFRERKLRELYLHMMVHVLYGHVVPNSEYPRWLWDLSCDISAWKLRGSVFGMCVEPEWEREGMAAVGRMFPVSLDLADVGSVCGYLRGHPEKQEQVRLLLGSFPRDDHGYWYRRNFSSRVSVSGEGVGSGSGAASGENGQIEYLERLHKKLAMAEAYRETWEQAVRPRRFGMAPGSRLELLELRREGQYDFRRYLKRFASVREKLQTDEDSFDYAWYLTGLARYGNMPLIEPLEYMEARRVEELVIAIDTSGSCSVGVVRRFLEETRNLLVRGENFFRRMNVHIIQCDSMVQQHRVITSVEDWQRYERELTVEGRGGTDFTPVFSFVEKLRRSGDLKKLRGLLYFTDGDGVYPRMPTDYETIFVFAKREFLEGDTAREIPSWAVKVCLDM